jgi:hypothetical protein
MKSAKEWAAEAVQSVEADDAVYLHSPDGYRIPFDLSVHAADADETAGDARGTIERLVERVQVDALAGTCRVWELFGGQVRLFESGDVKHWDEDKGHWCPDWGSWGTSPLVRLDEVRWEEWQAVAEQYQLTSPHSKSTGP